MVNAERLRVGEDYAKLLTARLAYPLRCLADEATDPELSNTERSALVRERVARIREIRRELAATENPKTAIRRHTIRRHP